MHRIVEIILARFYAQHRRIHQLSGRIKPITVCQACFGTASQDNIFDAGHFSGCPFKERINFEEG